MKLFIKNYSVIFCRYTILLLFFIIQIGMVQASIHNKVNELNFEINDVVLNDSQPVFITIPFPKDYFHDNQRLTLLWEGAPIPFIANAHLYWPSIKLAINYVRAITIKLPSAMNGSYTIKWSDNKGQKLSLEPLSANKYHHIQLSNKWLSKISYAPTLPERKIYRLKWFDTSYQHYGWYITEKEKHYSIKKASPWLFDKVSTLYQLYFKTGDLKWKYEAHKTALFYKENIGEDGFFKLKKKDMKYLYGNGLLYDYIFYPATDIPEVIDKLYKNTLAWPAVYSPKKGFWTERHLSNALNLAITQWEITNKKEYLKRINELLYGIADHLQLNSNYAEACLVHKLSQHEGKKDGTLVCSPWMTALVSEQLWHYYILTGNELAQEIIIRLSELNINKYIYKGSGPHLKGYVIPDYLVFFSKSSYEDRGQWKDMQHACDIAGLLARGLYLKKKNKAGNDEFNTILNKLLSTCKKSTYKNPKTKAWPIKPLRKFNWWFGSTSNLSWLYEEIRADN